MRWEHVWREDLRIDRECDPNLWCRLIERFWLLVELRAQRRLR